MPPVVIHIYLIFSWLTFATSSTVCEELCRHGYAQCEGNQLEVTFTRIRSSDGIMGFYRLYFFYKHVGSDLTPQSCLYFSWFLGIRVG